MRMLEVSFTNMSRTMNVGVSYLKPPTQGTSKKHLWKSLTTASAARTRREGRLQNRKSKNKAMYDAIQRLDKKFDLLQGKVSEMQRARVKPLLLKPRPVGFTYRSSNPIPHGKIRVQKPMTRESSLSLAPPEQGSNSLPKMLGPQKSHVQTNSAGKSVQPPQVPEMQQPAHRQSPPLPTIVSTHSLQPPYMAVNQISDLPTPPNLVNLVMESAGKTASSAMSSPLVSSVMPTQPETSLGRNAIMMNRLPSPESASVAKEMPSSSVCINPSFEYVGDPKRNVKVLGTYLMKARQKTKPKYAARYLVRVLFPKETLLCSVMGVSARGRRPLDPNKVAAIREFLATFFPNYDLSEYGRDWKTCITNVNAMIRCLCCETKIRTEKGEGKNKVARTPDPTICVDLSYSEEDEVTSQSALKTTTSAKATPRNAAWDGNAFPEVFQPPPSNKMQSLEPMELLGNPWRNVQLPFSVIYVAKGKSRPELSARYLIRHLFTEEVLVKSNVYGNLERGMCPLDCNRINALRDFLQENYPSFDLTETGYDWKACVAAINSTIRSLRHDHKKATTGFRRKVVLTASSDKSPPRSPSLGKLQEKDPIRLMD
ncbi:BEN domain-containing protein 2 isoform X2 [Tachyglossus aculeatus]|uniref:BEN domain-containing protein 2 isoform X2 n=1 Tax=Tachyglossus aculeatus TaxID=9261 RepID=UPI0018F58141|nr:BEN domain-containing protein 2 isoform X2 [Tachyglossus aculeatus]